MRINRAKLREAFVEGPTWLFYQLLGWFYPTSILRMKAAMCPYKRTRLLLLRRSGIAIGKEASINFGVLVHGFARRPPAVTFGNRCAVAPYVCFVTSSYPDESYLGQHPEVKGMINRLGPIIVGEDAWIGAGAIIFPGVNIGAGAIIGAGTIVRSDVPPYTIVAGCPARVLRHISSNVELK